ncbi:hypothetical protein TSUD_272740 [Trifolium subterraneum]|uniref:Uncharacterized protein n=1 Tax=Trifolium subterraneum TaxID=3900 RepID=A0A2Z6PT35_TRISU|nr:hypothetical protein TSUD_272740 [Trifolium subterraneum]
MELVSLVRAIKAKKNIIKAEDNDILSKHKFAYQKVLFDVQKSFIKRLLIEKISGDVVENATNRRFLFWRKQQKAKSEGIELM